MEVLNIYSFGSNAIKRMHFLGKMLREYALNSLIINLSNDRLDFFGREKDSQSELLFTKYDGGYYIEAYELNRLSREEYLNILIREEISVVIINVGQKLIEELEQYLPACIREDIPYLTIVNGTEEVNSMDYMEALEFRGKSNIMIVIDNYYGYKLATHRLKRILKQYKSKGNSVSIHYIASNTNDRLIELQRVYGMDFNLMKLSGSMKKYLDSVLGVILRRRTA